jgi:ComF family protein
VIPVPLHREKLKVRGYNQSEIIAKIISRIIKKDYKAKILLKIKNTPSQTNLKKAARKVNLINAFGICNAKKDILKGKMVLLVDDVVTTGATVNECSKVLLKNGVKGVRVISIARR